MENSPFYEELLTLGEHLHERERLALYKFLIESKSDTYKSNAMKLLKFKELKTVIANGEISLTIKDVCVSYTARELSSTDFTSEIRKMKLIGMRFMDIRRLTKFFAQIDVDVIQNFPLPGPNVNTQTSYVIDAYPYYTLAYYANGRNYLKGLIRKLRTNDQEILTKLRTL